MPESKAVKEVSLSSYVWIRFYRSKDPAMIDDLGKWLQDCELPAMFEQPAIRQAALYRDLHFPNMQQRDYFTTYRFDTCHYERTRDEIKRQCHQVSGKHPAPGFLVLEQEPFYTESHKCNRVLPRIPAYDPGFAGPVFKKHAMYGFAHSANERRREEFITWYQAERQHDVLREFFPFDNAGMWLLCAGERFPEYVFTLYEFSPSNLARTMDVLQGAYAALNWLRSSDLYVTGYAGVLEVVAELFKEA